jgi:hypothetical protein
MKKGIFFLLLSLSASAFSEGRLDNSKLALLGSKEISTEHILLTDSLLVEIINFHNKHLERPDLADLRTDQQIEYQNLVTRRAEVTPCIKENGKFSYHILYDRHPKGPGRDSVYADYLNLAAIDSRIKELEDQTATTNRIIAWSEDGPIDLSTYHRQYDFSIDLKGNVLVHIICICDDVIKQLGRNASFKWGSKMYTVEDQTKCTFSLHMNVTKREAFGLYVHSKTNH